jgi:hypothetical protein
MQKTGISLGISHHIYTFVIFKRFLHESLSINDQRMFVEDLFVDSVFVDRWLMIESE